MRVTKDMPTPTDLKSLKRFLGIFNHLSKFLPNLSSVSEPLLRLEVKDAEWRCHFAFACRALTPAEGRYAQSEKELLLVVFARRMFDTYLGHCACENRSSASGNYV